MEAIEFVTHAKRGSTITIPEEYKNDVSGEIRVIILIVKKESEKKPKKEFKALDLKTKGFKFNRKKIYDE